MSENRDKKFPRSDADKRGLIDEKFPNAKPIFWGPNQFTQFPDTYNEPSGWYSNQLLKIPQVLRMFTGGAPAPTDVFRTIFLGSRRYGGCNYFDTSIGTYGLGTFVGYGWFILTETKTFNIYTNIASAYGANKSTEQLMDAYIIKETHVSMALNGDGSVPIKVAPMRDVSMLLVENTYDYGIPAGMLTGKRPMQSGSKIGADDSVPAGSPYDLNPAITYRYTGQDADGNKPDEGPGVWRGDEAAKVGPYARKIMRLPSNVGEEYFFLRNIISGGTQVNLLYNTTYSLGITPDSPEWPTLLFYVNNYSTVEPIPGLILQP